MSNNKINTPEVPEGNILKIEELLRQFQQQTTQFPLDRAPLETLVSLETMIRAAGHTPQRVDAFLKLQSGQSLTDLLEKLSNAVTQALNKMKSATTYDLIELLQQLGITIEQLNSCILYPQEPEFDGEGMGRSIEINEIELKNSKMAILLELLREHEIHSNDLQIKIGQNLSTMTRPGSYFAIWIAKLNKTILIHANYGQATFVTDGQLSNKDLSLAKDELQIKKGAQRIIFFDNRPEDWKSEVKKALGLDKNLAQDLVVNQAKKIIITPLNQEAYLPRINGYLDIANYPDKRKLKGKQIPEFSPDVVDEILKQRAEMFFVLDIEDCRFAVGVVDAPAYNEQALNETNHLPKAITSIINAVKSLMMEYLQKLESSGFMTKTELKRKIYTTIDAALKFIHQIPDLRNYLGNQGQITLAKKLGKINLGQIYSLASGILIDQEFTKLQWTKMEVPYEMVEKFETELQNNPAQYTGNQGQITLAKKLGKVHLGQIYSLASGILMNQEFTKLQWTKMNVPYEMVEKFETELQNNLAQYTGNQGQITLAKKLGKVHLGHLYSLARGVLIDQEFTKLQWTYMGVPYEIVEKFETELQNNPAQYTGNQGQITLAKKLGKIHLGQIYSLARGVLIDQEFTKLQWTYMGVPYEIVEKFETELQNNPAQYTGNQGQITLAKKLGKVHLGHLYSLASGILMNQEFTKLQWTYMGVPYEMVEKFETELQNNLAQYTGNQGQITLAKKLGKINLGHLYSLARGVLIDQEFTKLQWTYMGVPYEMVEKFETELQNNLAQYTGNQGQITLAKKLGKVHLGHLYSLASGILIDQEFTKLQWTKMNVPYEMVEKFETELQNNLAQYTGNQGQITLAKKLGKVHLGHLYSLASGILIDQEFTKLQWTKMNVPYEMVEKFETELQNNLAQYTGNQGQITLAKKLGKINLGQIYSLARGVLIDQEFTKLQWTYMGVPYEMVEKFETELQNNLAQYTDNQGQITLAKKLEINPTQLYSLASGLNLAKILNWTFYPDSE